MSSPPGPSPPPSQGAAEPTPASAPPADTLTPASSPPTDTRRCFVCLTDENARNLPRDWSTPCKCSLEGHQDCLLDWLADLEIQQKPLVCPQCKSKIRMIEQYDPLVHLGDYLNRLLTTWSPTILLSFIGSGALVGSALYGVEAIEIFAGPEAATHFIIKDVANKGLEGYLRSLIPLAPAEPSINFAHFFVLPFIGPGLILNRLNLGGIFSIPTTLLAISWANLGRLDASQSAWPPSFEQAMLMVPAIKSTYYYVYRKLFFNMEKRWERIARAPHLYGDDARNLNNTAQAERHAVAAADANREGGEDRELLFQAQINFNFGGNGGPEENEINPEDNVGDVPQPANAAVGGNGGGNAHGGGGEGRQRVFDLGDKSPFNFIAGALTFPAVCYGAGEILRAVLPARMVTRPLRGPLTGLLQERWGRSLVGGCLFVVLKDAFFLYVKYRRAMIRPLRKIVNEKNRNVHP
ncbi:uncharacterized protein B0I36DRAFT_309242 [Microdochium trichocladiopsis]|uniref:RING-CH-type domain-containing protein n=1 Tax=Microdochium trichocladiopsis TaxID=1682393 RepID=A0A9P9BZ58_9PEZI|nr:uncharacterized protein B0I36DRAFT_309242 [Microdochium trichocladiopsis]KAH7039764.1 hypothetical protein B0I36DRAFT_309242 [Microdochium trichocladiopsis]